MSAPGDIYKKLSEILARRRNQILDIEILPPPLGPLLQDGLSVGISKKALVQAFVTARHIFFASIERFEKVVDNPGGTAVPAETNLYCDTKTCIASEVILLFDSEHLTACNWRKRRICQLLKEKELHHESAGFIDAINAEIAFTTTLLRSPLHRHAKSPNLWQHRRWVISQALEADIGSLSALTSLRDPCVSAKKDAIEQQILLTELSVVFKAGEHHPKNYYAFSYLRKFLHLLGDAVGRTTESEAVVPSPGQQYLVSRIYTVQRGSRSIQILAEGIVDEVHTWCLSHLRDISGWMFLYFLLGVVNETAIQTTAVNRAVQFALDVEWTGESLWTFVDLSVREFGISVDMFGSLGDDDKGGAKADFSVSPQPGWRSWVAKANALRIERGQKDGAAIICPEQ